MLQNVLQCVMEVFVQNDKGILRIRRSVLDLGPRVQSRNEPVN